MSRIASYAVSRIAKNAVSRLAKHAVSRLAKYAVSRLAKYVVSRLVDYAVSSRDLLTTQLADYALFALATRLAVSSLYMCGCLGHIVASNTGCAGSLHEYWLGGVPREQKVLKGHLPRVICHQVYLYRKKKVQEHW